ncbi:MAG: CapA family protein [Dysgonomonas sp.]
MKKYAFILLLLNLSLLSSAQEKKVRLLFAGDAMQHRAQLEAAKTKDGYDYSSYFQHVKKQIEKADIAIVNLEVTLGGKPYSGYPAFSAPDEFAQELKNAGFDIFLTANNHCLDKGKKGLERTILMLDSLRIRHLGTYKNQAQRNFRYPMMLKKNGIRIALLNYTYGTNDIKVQSPNIVNYIDKKQILQDIDMAKCMYADVIIANIHWGEEYRLNQNKGQKELAEFLIKNGVNIIIGGHPHVVQPIDIRKENGRIKQVIAYSMGNFVSNMTAPNTDGGMMVEFEISKNEKDSVEINNCGYSLVWVHKPVESGRKIFQLVPVKNYEEETKGTEFLGTEAYGRMMKFARKAKETVEKMWQ